MAPPTITKLGILAGTGALPKQLAQYCKVHTIPYFILAFQESLDEAFVQQHEHEIISLGEIGKGIELLKQAGACELVLAGHIKRPPLRSLTIDTRAKKLLKQLGMKLLGGDDAMLRALITFLENEGFTILAPHTILGGLTVEAGILSKAKPDKEHQASIEKAMQLLKQIGPLDIGQSIVIENDYVLGIEAAEGTDELIKRCKNYMRADKRTILVKAKKSGQDERADMPTIGPNTVEILAEYQYAGIAIEANHVLMIDSKQLCDLANQHELFVVAI